MGRSQVVPMKSKTITQMAIDKERALYHYYRHKHDLLSRCKCEVHKHKLEELKKQSAIESYQQKVSRFIDQYPEYKDQF